MTSDQLPAHQDSVPPAAERTDARIEAEAATYPDTLRFWRSEGYGTILCSPLLREYHAALGLIVFRYEGTVERFTGDGMMVFFNDPIPCPDPARRAVPAFNVIGLKQHTGA
jgi:hypothetical protein